LRCLDAFHAVGWVTDALDEVRRQVWNQLRGGKGQTTPESKAFKNARWALWKNPDRLNEQQQATLASIQATNRPLYRAYLLEEQFRELIQIKGDDGKLLLTAWLRWAGRSKVPATAAGAEGPGHPGPRTGRPGRAPRPPHNQPGQPHLRARYTHRAPSTPAATTPPPPRPHARRLSPTEYQLQ
jgi:hypothetical protein